MIINYSKPYIYCKMTSKFSCFVSPEVIVSYTLSPKINLVSKQKSSWKIKKPKNLYVVELAQVEYESDTIAVL